MATETKVEDGIYEHESGVYVLIYIEGGMFKSSRKGTPEPLSELVDLSKWHRLADLSGRPVVDERVIEAIATDHEWATRDVRYILTKHLLPQPEAGGEGEATIERDKLLKAISAAGFQVMRTSGDWSIHDVSELAKRDEERTEQVINENIDLTAERDRLQARVAELEATPTTNRYRETATGDEWVFLPEERGGRRVGLRFKDKLLSDMSSCHFVKNFTLQPPAADAPIVPFEGAFVCWDENGAIHTAWPLPEDNSYRFAAVRHSDMNTDMYYTELFEDEFTRTPPTPPTLPPEHEKLVGPLADKLGKSKVEVREALATCAGG